MADFAGKWRDYNKFLDDDVELESVEEVSPIIHSKRDNNGEEDIETVFRSPKWKDIEVRGQLDKRLFWFLSIIFLVPIFVFVGFRVQSYIKGADFVTPLAVQTEISENGIYLSNNHTIFLHSGNEKDDSYNNCLSNVGSIEIVNLTTGEIMYQYNPNSPRYIASISKLVTAYIAYKNYDLDELITFIEPRKYYLSDIGLQEGEFITVESAIEALLVLSANDVGYMLADNHKGGADSFIKEMNEVSKNLDLKVTTFADPNGINEDNAFSTAHETISLLNFVLQIEHIKRLLETQTVRIPVYTHEGDFLRYVEPSYNNNYLKNRNELIFTGEADGGKTGTNVLAKQNLIFFKSTADGIVVYSILGADDRVVTSSCLLAIQ